MASKNSSGGGMGLIGVLTVIFVVLKCVDVIAWSWWWVFSPIWISLCFAIVFGIIYAISLIIFK